MTLPQASLGQQWAMALKNNDSGKLRIGDDWNAIRIIALSQSSRRPM
jgi:hypothetical protein